MNEQEYSLSYALTPNLGRSAKSVGVKRYSALMKSSGTFGDAELQEALAKESGAKIEFVRYDRHLTARRERGKGCHRRSLPLATDPCGML